MILVIVLSKSSLLSLRLSRTVNRHEFRDMVQFQSEIPFRHKNGKLQDVLENERFNLAD